MFYALHNYVTVTGRNRTLFSYIFQPHYHVWSAVPQNFH